MSTAQAEVKPGEVAALVQAFQTDVQRLLGEIGQVIVGHEEIVRGAVMSLLAGGHALLEGVPGLGKTMLVKTIAEALDLNFSRVQFTPDLMPADILGTNMIVEDERGSKYFDFQRGAIFANIVLADEINRATPKTQSALLEAMQEQRVTVAKQTFVLEPPFFVLATQNPLEMEGTYPLPEAQLDRFFMKLKAEIGKVVVGHSEVVDGVLIALFAGGNVLLEGVPGLGKTLLVKTLDECLSLPFNRIQFTPDLMPADVIGTNIVTEDPATGRRGFQFQRGPIFAQIVLADEINRATPKTQSALLEAMQERSVTVAGTTYKLDKPFFVLATQNPIEQAGTYRLPEAQLDRFIMKASIGYPDHSSTLRILEGAGNKAHEIVIPPIVTADVVVEMGQLARTVHVDPTINDYVSRLVEATRTASEVRLGASVRGALALIRTAKTLAAASGRHYVIPDDVKALAEPVLAHRLIIDPEAEFDGVTAPSIMGQILIETPPPSERQAV